MRKLSHSFAGRGLFRNVPRPHAQDQTVRGRSVVLQEVVTRADGTNTRGDGSSTDVPKSAFY
jgi:hypothetical protein